MKKIISLVLCVAMVLSCTAVSAFAENKNLTVFASGIGQSDINSKEYKDLIVFVTGIGQSYTYLFDKKYLEEGSFENGTLHDYENYTSLIENNQYSERWNLIYNFGNAFKSPVFVADVSVLITQIIMSCIFGKRLYSGALKNAISEWLKYNTILSPDKSIDISTTWCKDSTWFIYKEMHDLKQNKNALSLAIDLATGKIKTVYDCDSTEDGLYYPQFSSVVA